VIVIPVVLANSGAFVAKELKIANGSIFYCHIRAMKNRMRRQISTNENAAMIVKNVHAKKSKFTIYQISFVRAVALCGLSPPPLSQKRAE